MIPCCRRQAQGKAEGIIILPMRLKRLSLLIAVYSLAYPVFAVEFDTSILNLKDHSNIDLSAFSQDNYVAPGDYLLDVYLDGNLVAKQHLIRYQMEPADRASATLEKVPVSDTGASGEKKTYACISPQLAALFALKKTNLQQLEQNSQQPEQCVNFVTAQTSVTYTAQQQRLDITVPQAWLEYQDPYWIPPSRWDNGVPGMLFDYNLMYNNFKAQNSGSSEDISLIGTLGFNAGAWRLRSDYQYSYSRSANISRSRWNFQQTYLFRPLPAIKSRVSAGQVYFSSSLFDNFRFTGLSLESDLRMLPPSLQGYAPQISGVARTQAQVTLSQNGRILYQASVSPGPFVLPPLNQTTQGELDVTVRESDGEVKNWQVNTASVQLMVRPGQFIYHLSGGKTSYSGANRADGTPFVAGEAQWGIFNKTTLYGGLIVAGSDYNTVALGVGRDMGQFGALSFDATRSDARLPGVPRQSGFSYRVNYTKSFDRSGTSLSFIGYRFSEKSFITLPRFDSLRHGRETGSQEKQSITASFSQSLAGLGASLLLSASRLSYWNAQPGENYQISVNKSLHFAWLPGARTTLTFSRSRSGLNRADNQIYLSVDIPFGSSSYLGYSLSRDSRGAMEQNLNYSRFTDNNINWGVGVSHNSGADYVGQGGENTLRGNIQYQSDYGQLTANTSVNSRDYRSFGLNWYGSATATRHGVALHPFTGGNEPQLMIDAGTSGVPVNGTGKTNLFGVMVVNASSYTRNEAWVDVSALPDDVEVTNSVVSDVLTEGAIGYQRIATEKGGQLYGVIRLADGKAPPFAAQVISLHGRQVGMVGEGGEVLLSGLHKEDNQTLVVKTGDGGECHLQLPDKYSLDQGMILLPCQ